MRPGYDSLVCSAGDEGAEVGGEEEIDKEEALCADVDLLIEERGGDGVEVLVGAGEEGEVVG